MRVEFLLENGGNGTDFKAPDFRGFRLISGPSRSMQTTIINGNMTQSVGYGFQIQAKTEGNFTIGSASIRANNKVYRTDPLEIVVQASKLAGSENEKKPELFLKMEISKDTLFPGQQEILSYNLYYRNISEIFSYDLIAQPNFSAFHTRILPNFRLDRFRKLIDGVEYSVRTIRKICLFPQKSGKYLLDPVNLRVNIPVERSGNRGFFFNRSFQPVVVSGENLELVVNELPKPPPMEFNGSVGRYSMDVSVSSFNPSISDVVSLKVYIEGDGDIKRVQAPRIVADSTLKVYEPKILRETSSDDQGKIIGQKSFEFLIAPQKLGMHLLDVQFHYFHPDSSEYEILSSGVLVFQISEDKTGSISSESDVENQLAKMHPLIVERGRRGKNEFSIAHPFYFLLLLIPIVPLGIVYYKRRQFNNFNALSREDKAFRMADKKAQQRLQQAEELLHTSQAKEYYHALRTALLNYLTDKFKIAPGDLDKLRIEKILLEKGLNHEKVNSCIRLLQHAEFAEFAPVRSETAQEEDLLLIREIILDMEINSLA